MAARRHFALPICQDFRRENVLFGWLDTVFKCDWTQLDQVFYLPQFLVYKGSVAEYFHAANLRKKVDSSADPGKVPTEPSTQREAHALDLVQISNGHFRVAQDGECNFRK
uniref:Uncharacterized protein n=2 Tax=Caenorhabditis japonica TaxID=281687 RepID=A0A8R1IVB7_CAEJA